MIKKTTKIVSSMFLILFLLVIVGCEDYLTKITMKSEAGKLKRVVVISSDDPKKEEVLKYYEVPEGNSLDDIEMMIYGNFKNHMNGVGSFNSLQTSIGSAHFYSENFLGIRDFAQELENLDQKIDTGIELLNGWLQKNLGNTSQYVQLDKFLHSEFKKDVKNTILILQASYFSMDKLERLKDGKKFEIGDDVEDALRDEFALIMVQFAIEKGYLVPEKDFPLLYRKYGEVFDSPEGIADTLIHENFKRRFGYTYEQIDPVLNTDGLEAYIKNTSLFVEFQNAQRIENGDPNLVPDSGEFFISLFGDVDFVFSDTDKVDVELFTGIEPLETNGEWDETSETISWNSKIERNGIPKLPEVVYAFWVSHDISFQEKHFGRVLVEESELLEYCMWHASLDKQDKNEWDSFLLSLKPYSEANSDPISQIIYLEKAFNDFEFSEIKDDNLKDSNEREEFRNKGKDNFLSEIRDLKKREEGENITEEKKPIEDQK